MVEPFPRALRLALALALPVAVVSLPRLRLGRVRDWLRDHTVPCSCPETDRPLRACLAAWSGHGFIFLDAVDSADEQRFSLAHEVAHFLRHYEEPRRRACRHLGAQAQEVLDGRRRPTPAERIHALFRDVPLGFHLHLMRRGRRGGTTSEVAVAEDEADRLAYELLAPERDVIARAGAGPGSVERTKVRGVLRALFGLPAAAAEDYSNRLVPVRREDPLLRRLRSRSV